MLLRQGVASPRATAIAPRQFGGGSYGSIDGSIAEVLVYSGVLGAADRDALRSYLRSRYGL